MDLDFINDFEKLKISAFSKVKTVNNQIKDVTIGPNSTIRESSTKINKKTPKVNGKTEPTSSSKSIPQENQLPIRLAIKELEFERQQKVQERMKARIEKFNEFSNLQEQSHKQELIAKQEAFIRDAAQKEIDIIKEVDKINEKTLHEKAKLESALAERRKQLERERLEKERLLRVLQENLDKIRKNQNEYYVIYKEIVGLINVVNTNEELKQVWLKEEPNYKNSLDIYYDLLNKCKSSNIAAADVTRSFEMVESIKNIKSQLDKSIEAIKSRQDEKKKLEEQRIKEEEARKAAKAAEASKAAQTAPDGGKISANLSEFISERNLKVYLELMDFHDKFVKSFQQFSDDASLKQYKFELKKAINTPVNTISAVNTEHLLDKYNRLHSLLSGKTIVLSDKQINAGSHPQGISFCKDTLAKKFVVQGDLMISSNPESAFAYATIIVSLWNDFPDFGRLLLAHFYKACPVLVPYYVPHLVNESDEDFFRKQGYQYNNGQVEAQDKYLKRMTGIMRLYAAIFITKPKKGQNGHPFNIKNGWTWLASLLKLEPRIDITATLLHTFLETVGFEMEAKYGRVFRRVVQLINNQFLPKCRGKCTGGAVTRLELLLMNYFKNNRFEKPAGHTPYAFW